MTWRKVATAPLLLVYYVGLVVVGAPFLAVGWLGDKLIRAGWQL